MKILQIYELAPLDDNIGGVEVCIMSLSKELVAMGHEVTVLCGTGDKEFDVVIDGVRVVGIDFCGLMKWTWNGSRLTLLRQFFFPFAVLLGHRREFDGYDVYHGHIYTSGLLARILAARNHAVSANTIHGSYYDVWNILTGPVSAYLYRKVERFFSMFLADSCDVQFHTGKYFAKMMIGWGADPDKLCVLQNGVDVSAFSSVCKEGGFGGDDNCDQYNHLDNSFLGLDIPMILTARRLVKKNGVEYLLAAMVQVLEQVECMLVIVGDGDERGYLEEMACELGVSDNVMFMGAVAHEMVGRYIAASTVVVVPSIMEASSIFMLEAMAMGKPVVASNVGDIPEVIDADDDCGVLVEAMDAHMIADAIVQLLGDGDMRIRIGDNARRRVEGEFTTKKVAQRVEKAYCYAIKSK